MNIAVTFTMIHFTVTVSPFAVAAVSIVVTIVVALVVNVVVSVVRHQSADYCRCMSLSSAPQQVPLTWLMCYLLTWFIEPCCLYL